MRLNGMPISCAASRAPSTIIRRLAWVAGNRYVNGFVNQTQRKALDGMGSVETA